MHSHDVWSSETLHILKYLWERTVLEQHWVLLEKGEGRGEERRGEEGEERRGRGRGKGEEREVRGGGRGGGRGTFRAEGT